MQTRYWTTIVGTALAFALSSVSEAGIERNLAGGRETIECGGQSVELNVASSDVTLLGSCPHVEVNGSSNTVRIEQARLIEITGTGNTVIWERGPNGKRPSIDDSGLGNTAREGKVAAGGVASAGAGQPTTRQAPDRPAASRLAGDSAIAILDNGRTETIACRGKDVTVDGNDNDLTLTGECGRVEVSGDANVVRVEVAAAIFALGDRNKVTWARGIGGKAPKVTSLGSGNDISRISE